MLGIAAFLGAGYRVPLAAVMFVAETTGRPGFVVPALIAAASSQLLMGRGSVSPYQQDSRTGLLDARLSAPCIGRASHRRSDRSSGCHGRGALRPSHHASFDYAPSPLSTARDLPGFVALDDVAGLPRAKWQQTMVKDIMRDDWPHAEVNWTLAPGRRLYGAGRCGSAARRRWPTFVGMITTGEILKLDAILGRAEERGLPGH